MDIPYPNVGSVDHSEPEHPVGATMTIKDPDDDSENTFMYVKVVDQEVSDGDVADVAQIYNSDGFVRPQVTTDRNGSNIGQVPVGVFTNSIAQGNYGWIQNKGLHTGVQKETGSGTDLAAGDQVTTDPNNDASVAAVSAHDDVRIGTVLADASTASATVSLVLSSGLTIP
jgi:predicted RecA/RadA family phage recombinase